MPHLNIPYLLSGFTSWVTYDCESCLTCVKECIDYLEKICVCSRVIINLIFNMNWRKNVIKQIEEIQPIWKFSSYFNIFISWLTTTGQHYSMRQFRVIDLTLSYKINHVTYTLKVRSYAVRMIMFVCKNIRGRARDA